MGPYVLKIHKNNRNPGKLATSALFPANRQFGSHALPSRAVSPSPCVDRRAPIIRPVHNSVGGKASERDECQRVERTKLHMLSTGARRATSASRGAKAKRRPDQCSDLRSKERRAPPNFRANRPFSADLGRIHQIALICSRKALFSTTLVASSGEPYSAKIRLLCE